jgi:hypothetical protein
MMSQKTLEALEGSYPPVGYITTSPHILGSWVDLDTISCIRRSIFIDFGESNGL